MKFLSILLLSLFSNLSFAQSEDYLICNIGDLNPNRSSPYVATLVISPEVNGQHYFTSLISSKKDNRIVSGVGPLVLVNPIITQDILDLNFSNLNRNDVLIFKTITAQAQDHYFEIYKSVNKKDVMLHVPRGYRKAPKTTSISCYKMDVNRVEHLYSDVDTSMISINNDRVQNIGELTFDQARDKQIALLYQHIKKKSN
jgi:hypothetical protein